MTPGIVAAWMLEELNLSGILDQEEAVYEIEKRFGEEFIYSNENGNPAIRKDVLAAFRELTGPDVVWERGERLWRKRADYDDPGRMQL